MTRVGGAGPRQRAVAVAAVVLVLGVLASDEGVRRCLGAVLARAVRADLGPLGTAQAALWALYLVAAIALPASHIRPILKYLRGSSGIGDACIRTECVQCLWRVPALLFATFVEPSVPLFLSVALDLVGRLGRVAAMRVAHRRWAAVRVAPPDRWRPPTA